MSVSKFLSRLRRHDSGNVMAICAAVMPLLMGSAALAIDAAQLALRKRQLQRVADSSALAGARALSQGKSVSDAVARDLLLNNQVALTGTTQVQNAPTAGAFANDARAVRVVINTQPSLPFWSFFTTAPTLTSEATARIIRTGEYCMYAAEDGNVAGITIGGNARLRLGCGMVTNSRASQAVTAGGSSFIIATPIGAVGGLTPSSNFQSPTTLIPYSTPLSDPLGYLPDPVLPPGNCNNRLTVQPSATATINAPATGACYRGMDIKGTLNLGAGTYFINGDSFSAGSQAVVNCNGCTIVLTSSTAATNGSSVASLDIGAGARLTMTASSTGTYAGVLFYQDRRATLLNQITINGNGSGSLEGAIYLPRANLTMNGASGMNTRCFQLIGRRLNFNGDGEIENVCPAGGASRAYNADFVRLVA
jgi:Flp pilus assembly protein TadG